MHKIPDDAGEGWTRFDGTNQPADGDALCKVVTVGQSEGNYWESYTYPVKNLDWSIEGDEGDIIAFRLVGK